MVAVNDILRISQEQGYTCMYSEGELKTFPQERLDNIYEGIAVLPKHRAYRKVSPAQKSKRKRQNKGGKA
jgi:hypothetical protein